MRERTAAVSFLRHMGEHDLADAFEKGAHLFATRHPLGARHNEYFRCGHPRTPENIQRVGIDNGVRCKTCRREMRLRVKERIR